jgi:hypothetical protein
MESILRHKGLPEEDVEPMVQAFIEKSEQAERDHSDASPVT